MKLSWLSLDGSHFCVRLQERNLLPEWHVVGQVQLRQVYDTVPPKFYSTIPDPSKAGADVIVGRFYDLDSAKAAIEATAV